MRLPGEGGGEGEGKEQSKDMGQEVSLAKRPAL